MRVFVFVWMVLATVWANADGVTFAGSSTIMPIIEDMTPVFKSKGVSLSVQGGGSSAGIKSVKMGMAEVGMVSRPLTPDEHKIYQKLTLAHDWVVLIANQATNLNNISTEEVVDIYSNPTNKKYHVIAKEDGRATKEIFDAHFNLAGKLRKDLIIIGANGQAIATVEKDPSAVAYVSYSAAYEAKKQGAAINILLLDGIEGSATNVVSGEYKLARELNLVYLKKNAVLMDKLISILSSPEAEDIFSRHNVISSLTAKMAASQ